METDVKMRIKKFSIFVVDKDLCIAIPTESDGKYDYRLVYLLGKQALRESAMLDLA